MNDCQKAEFLNFSSCTMNHRVLLTHKGTLVSVKCINSPSNQFVALLNEKWKINKSKYGCLSRTQGLWLKLKNNEERRKSMLAKDSRTMQCVCASLRERFQILRGMVLTSLDAWFLLPPNFQLLTKWWLGKKFSTIARFTTEWSCSCTISTVLSKHLHSRKPSPRSYGCWKVMFNVVFPKSKIPNKQFCFDEIVSVAVSKMAPQKPTRATSSER